MATWTIPVTSTPNPKELNPNAIGEESSSALEDKYYRLKGERDRIATQFNDLEDANRILRTRCASLEAFKKRAISGAMDKGELASSLIDTIGKPQQDDYEDLFKSYDLLQRDYRALVSKHKSSLQVISKLKKELQSLKLRLAGSRNNDRSNYGCRKQLGGCRKVLKDLQELKELDDAVEDFHCHPEADKENVENDIVISQLQQRLNSAEAQLQNLNLRSPQRKHRHEDSISEELATRVHLLEAQKRMDESKLLASESRIRAQAEKLDKILSWHKEYKARHATLKKELHLCQDENQALEFQVSQLEECAEQVDELTHHNQMLEEKVRKLCELNMPKEGGQSKMIAQQLQEKQKVCEDLKKENRELKEENKQLNSQLDSAQSYFASKKKDAAKPSTVSNRLIDVWQQLDLAQQQCIQKDEQLHMQTATNRRLENQLKDAENGFRKEFTSQASKVEELQFIASQRLQRIRMLETQLTKEGEPTCLTQNTPPLNTSPGENVLEVTVHGGVLKGNLLETTKSFVLVDFHSFDSELSDVVCGNTPKYNFTVSYEIEVDCFVSNLLAKGAPVRIEVYKLQNERNAPSLFAYASVSTQELSQPSGALHFPKLKLFHVESEDSVGTLDVSMRLAQPISDPEYPPAITHPARETTMGLGSSRGRIVVPDAISILIETVTLSDTRAFDNQTFYVHYRFLSFGDVLTSLECADAKGVITFQHKSSFPILSTDDGSLDSILSALSKGGVHFTLFSGIKKHEKHESESYNFQSIGEAQVPLSDIWGHAKLSADIISLDARIVGSIDVTFDTKLKPTSDKLKQTMRQSSQKRFMTLLSEITPMVGGKEPDSINTPRLLCLLDPPSGIIETVKLLHQQISNHFPGRLLSEILSLSPNHEEKVSLTQLQRCSNDTRHKALLPDMPPTDELEDLYHYMSHNDGMVCIHDLNYFVASESLHTLASACQELHGMKRTIRKDIREIEAKSNGVINVPQLREYFDELFDGLTDGELSKLFSLICNFPKP